MRRYYDLTKPGIIYGNTLTAVAGYLFGLQVFHLSFGWVSAAALIIGLGMTMGSACVFNNIIDRDIDARMERTKERALPMGTISLLHAFLFGSVLFVLGLGILYFFVSPLAFLVTLAGVFAYVCVYTPAKRFTPQSTIIGAFPGAVPPVVGYVAAAGVLNLRALVLFLILVTWQMTHFFAIALYRMDEYRAAGLPVMPLFIGTTRTKLLMFLYALCFSYAAYALYALGGLNLWYVVVMAPLCLLWLVLAVFSFYAKDTRRWARRMFFFSLIVLLCVSFAIAFS